MTRHLYSNLLLVLLVFAAPLNAAEPDTLDLLPRLLSRARAGDETSFKAIRGPNGWEVSYCPDNTCDVIRAPHATPRDVIGDFGLLYLYYASGYIYLKSFYQTDAKALAAAVMSRRSTDCEKAREFTMASCVLTKLAIEYKIAIAIRRFDEGQTREEVLKLEDKLTTDRISEAKQWQFDAWKHYP